MTTKTKRMRTSQRMAELPFAAQDKFVANVRASFNAAVLQGYEDDHYKFDGRMPVPKGLVVGEMPGHNTDGNIPLYPHFKGCAAERLIGYAGVSYKDWITGVYKVNLCKEKWSSSEARDTAAYIRLWCSTLTDHHKDALGMAHIDPKGFKVLVLGSRVRDAMGFDDGTPFGKERFTGSIEVRWIPHPSGRCRYYNDVKNQKKAGEAVRWLLGY
jgi:hypothetical protein